MSKVETSNLRMGTEGGKEVGGRETGRVWGGVGCREGRGGGVG